MGNPKLNFSDKADKEVAAVLSVKEFVGALLNKLPFDFIFFLLYVSELWDLINKNGNFQVFGH